MNMTSFSNFVDSVYIRNNETELSCDEWVEKNIKELKEAYVIAEKLQALVDKIK